MRETKFIEVLATIKEGEELRIINTGSGYTLFKNKVCIDDHSGIDLLSEERLIYEVLKDIGIPAHLSGYKYITKAIKLSLEIPEKDKFIAKSFYPVIARCYETSVTSVERAIRHAIETAFRNGKSERMNQIFGCRIPPKKCRPTNTQFISIVTEYIRLKEKSL